MERNCQTCSGRFKGCMLKDYITVDIEDKAECMLEEGTFEEVLREQVSLKDLFIHMQEEGIIKKNVKVEELAEDNTIMNLFIELTSDAIWDFVRTQVKQIEPDFYINVNSDFNCALWR